MHRHLPAPTFEFSGLAKIAHINLRKEDKGKTLAADIKISGNAPGFEMCMFFDERLHGLLFALDGVGMPTVRNVTLMPVQFAHLIEAELVIARTRFADAELSKFSVEALDGGNVRLTFTAHVKPTSAEAAAIAKCLADDVQVQARMTADLFAQAQQDAGAGAPA